MPVRHHPERSAQIGPLLIVTLACAIGLLSAAQTPVDSRAIGSNTTGSRATAGTLGGRDRAASASSNPGGKDSDATIPEPARPTGRQERAAFAGIPDPAVRGTTPRPAPGIVRFRPRNGWTEVSPGSNVSVRFTTAMDPTSTERAFEATTHDGTLVAGTLRWAEGNTVLVLDPAGTLPWGARVGLAVSAGALSAEGVPLAASGSVTFTVAAAPAPRTEQEVAPAPSTGWRWPLLGTITQYFGQSLTAYGLHQGIDIDGDTGDSVRAANAGRVVVAGHYDRCGGLEVHIDHGDGITSWYRHLSRIEVAVGATVDAGTVIGRVGDTGCSLGSHLHFAIRSGSTFVDPLGYLGSPG